MSHAYDFNITMTCGGCSGAVERVLKKLDGLFSSPLPPLSSPFYAFSLLPFSLNRVELNRPITLKPITPAQA